MVTMYGPAFTAEGKIVEREVPEVDVVAYEQSGYVKGKMPEGLAPVPRPSLAVKEEDDPKESKKKGK